MGNFGQALCIRSCHEDLILTRKSHNCAGIAFIQGDSAGGSKLIEQTLSNEIVSFFLCHVFWSQVEYKTVCFIPLYLCCHFIAFAGGCVWKFVRAEDCYLFSGCYTTEASLKDCLLSREHKLSGKLSED